MKMSYIHNSLFKKINGKSCFFLMMGFFIFLFIACVICSLDWVDKKFPGFLFNQRMVIVEIANSSWTGSIANLQKFDKLVTVNDTEINSSNELMDIVDNMPVGSQIVYGILRIDGFHRITIPSMRFKWTDLALTFGINLLYSLFFILIGSIVFFLQFGKPIGWAFFLSCYFVAVGGILDFDLAATHLGFVKIALITNAFIPSAFVHFALNFPVSPKFIQKYPNLQYLPYWVSLCLSIQLLYFYPGDDFVFYWNMVRLYSFLCAIGIISYLLWNFMKSDSLLVRQRLKTVLFGAILAFPLPTLLFFIESYSYSGSYFAKSNYSTYIILLYLAFPSCIAYAIAKHNLFDVDVYIKRTVGYLIMTGLVAITYFFIQTTLTQFVLEPLLGTHATGTYPIIFALLVVFLFNPLNAKVQHFVDRLFYRSQFDYKAMVLAIGNALSSVLKLPEIVNRITATVRQDMFIESAGLIVMMPDKDGALPLFTELAQPGQTSEAATDPRLTPSDPLIRLMEQERKLITRYDLEEDPRYRENYADCQPRFRELDATLALPLISHDQLIGILLVGNKKSGKFYTREDIDLLRTLANEGAVALQNANLLEENMRKSRMDEELKIARDIQMSMLPDQPPEITGFQIAARSYPAREVGGDFYDFIALDSAESPTQVGIVVGDVSGKAVSGALVMAASRSVLRVLAEAHQSIASIMNLGNARLCSDVRKGMFVALVYAIADSANRTLTLANAGQTQPILCPAQADKPPAYIETEGDCFPLGIIRESEYLETQIPLHPGDTLAFYTDGIVEALNTQGELYGFERLLTTLGAARHLDASTLLDRILDDVNDHVGEAEQHDDLTLVILKVA